MSHIGKKKCRLLVVPDCFFFKGESFSPLPLTSELFHWEFKLAAQKFFFVVKCLKLWKIFVLVGWRKQQPSYNPTSVDFLPNFILLSRL